MRSTRAIAIAALLSTATLAVLYYRRSGPDDPWNDDLEEPGAAELDPDVASDRDAGTGAEHAQTA